MQNQHHPNDDEMTKFSCLDSSVISTSISQFSDDGSVLTKINYNGVPLEIKCNPLKIVQFLMKDLREKLKDFVPEGKPVIMSKVL